MTESVSEKYPLRLKLVDFALTHLADPLLVPFFGLITAQESAMDEWAKRDGQTVDKTADGILKCPNEFAGSDRTAFCPIDSKIWPLRKVLYKLYGGHTVAHQTEKITHLVDHYVGEKSVTLPPTEVSAIEYARALVCQVSCEIFFDLPIESEEAQKLSESYQMFNRWTALATLTKGFADMGRKPRLNHYAQVSGEAPTSKHFPQSHAPLIYLSSLLFSHQHDQFNDSIKTISAFAQKVWEHLKQTNHQMYQEYAKLQKEYDISDAEVIVELTNVLGGIFSSPPSHLAFLLARYARSSKTEQQKIANDQEYREAFIIEIKRLYQPFPWLMRDIVSEVTVDGKTTDKGYFIYYNYTANRNKRTWGNDARQFRPQRFITDQSLKNKLPYFGKGKRRCPSGEIGEKISNTIFTAMLQRYTFTAHGDLEVNLKENVSPSGTIFIEQR